MLRRRPFVSPLSDGRRMARFVDHQVDSARKVDCRSEPERRFVLISDLQALSPELTESGSKIVAHQGQLMACASLGR